MPVKTLLPENEYLAQQYFDNIFVCSSNAQQEVKPVKVFQILFRESKIADWLAMYLASEIRNNLQTQNLK